MGHAWLQQEYCSLHCVAGFVHSLRLFCCNVNLFTSNDGDAGCMRTLSLFPCRDCSAPSQEIRPRALPFYSGLIWQQKIKRQPWLRENLLWWTCFDFTGLVNHAKWKCSPRRVLHSSCFRLVWLFRRALELYDSMMACKSHNVITLYRHASLFDVSRNWKSQFHMHRPNWIYNDR